jgi:hypothetical protein
MSYADYYDDHEHVSQSMLKVLDASPARYHALYVARTMEQSTTEAMRFGSMFHSAVLEPWEFKAKYAVPPKCDRRTTVGKQTFAAWCAENSDKTAVDADDFCTLIAMQAAILKHSDATLMLQADGPVEKPIRWHDRILRKAKPDKLIPSMGIIADVKTIADPSPRGFASAAAKFGWYLQASWYKHAAWHETSDDYRFLFICVGKERPHEVAIYELTDDDAEWSDVRTEQLVTELMLRQEKNDWLADWQQGDPTQVPLPAWIRSNFYETDGEKWQLQLPPETN